ncbi:MAG: gephyrin-like molybdotransferase receptor GlpR [Pseudonocardia sp.]
MPSSLIFASLVVLWLLILVPTVARRRQEVARPSTAALAGRVLARSRPGGASRRRAGEVVGEVDVEEVDELAGTDEALDGAAGTQAAVLTHAADDAPGPRAGWDRPAPRYRPGRGGFDPNAAALAARARYAFRQRVVLGLLVGAAATVVAALLVGPLLWWAAGVLAAVLVSYLVYLRRQVRMEETIRERRAARMAGTRRPAAAEDPDLDGWARRGRAAAAGPHGDAGAAADGTTAAAQLGPATSEDEAPDDDPGVEPDVEDDAPAAPAPAPAPEAEAEAEAVEPADPGPALPRLRPVGPPPIPSGTAPLGADDLDPDLPAIDRLARYRRAAGQ